MKDCIYIQRKNSVDDKYWYCRNRFVTKRSQVKEYLGCIESIKCEEGSICEYYDNGGMKIELPKELFEI
jgi:hypothetical protein